MRGIYTPEGWLNMPEIRKLKTPFIFVVGGRGIGKTYGAIKDTIDNNIRFMFMRRTQKQADLISVQELSPFKAPCFDMGLSYCTKTIATNCSGLYLIDGEGEKLAGYVTALSTISGLRGFDASDVDLWIYDEFIPERHERQIKFEGEAFLNAYETINRNRELNGRPPLKCLCLSNSNDVGNPIFTTMGIADIALKMQERGQNVYINDKRGISIILPHNSPISEQKKDTALYRAAGDGRFSAMAIGNTFEQETGIAARDLNEFTLMTSCGKLYFYKHKSTEEIYCTGHRRGTAEHYEDDYTSILQFRAANRWLQSAFLLGRLTFENVKCKRDFENIFYNRS